MIDGALGGPVDQDYLLQARQMQAMSFAVHIPLVCFGIAFPAMVLFLEGLWLRTGDPLYRALAKRWSKAMLILFAVGVVTGTILSFEMGLLWPEFMATFGEVFGLAFGIEGFSFFMEAIFIAIYVYGWDRLPPRMHGGRRPDRAGRHHGLADGDLGQRLDEPPDRLPIRGGEVVDVKPLTALFNDNLWHELVHMYLAGFIVAGFLVACVYAYGWLRGRRDRHHRVGLVVALPSRRSPRRRSCSWATGPRAPSRSASRSSWPRSRGSSRRPRAPVHAAGRDRDPRPAVAARLPRPERDGQGAGQRPGGRPAAGRRREAVLPADGRHRQRPGALGAWFLWSWWRRGRLPGLALVLPRAGGGGAAVAGGADRRLGHDRGRPPALGRLPR